MSTAPSVFPRLARPLLWLLLPLQTACGQVGPPATPAVPEVAAPPAPIVPDSLAWLHQRLDSSRVFRQHLVGVSIADVGTGQLVFGHHALAAHPGSNDELNPVAQLKLYAAPNDDTCRYLTLENVTKVRDKKGKIAETITVVVKQLAITEAVRRDLQQRFGPVG